MKAMLLTRLGPVREDVPPLEMVDRPAPAIGDADLLLRVTACGVCHTELDEIEGRTPPPVLPVVPGHQVVGRVAAAGRGTNRFVEGDRVGVAWIFSACGKCEFCRSDRENLCPRFRATGRDADGGYAEYLRVPEAFAHRIPEALDDHEAAPLLCAGAIGYRSLRLAELKVGQVLGLTGFGASAHLVLKLILELQPNCPVQVFARSEPERAFARELGAAWAGLPEERSPDACDAIIDTTPVWSTVLAALGNLKPGGRLVINAIRKEEIDKECLLQLDYPSQLWLEKEIKSVANVTRRDVFEFLELAARIPIRPEVRLYPLEEANRALLELKQRRIRGAKVLQIGRP